MNFIEFEKISESSSALAEHIYQSYLKQTGSIFTIVLSGGNSPIHLYKVLIDKYSDKFCWDRIYFFFADDRFVKQDSDYNNFKSAEIHFFNRIKEIKKPNIFPINTSISDPVKCAAEYEKSIRNFFISNNLLKNNKDIPQFDFTILGMGPDGHTASIFPGYREMHEKNRLVSATEISPTEPRVQRITMTFPLLNNSKESAFLVSQKGKEQVLDRIRKKNAAEVPAAMVKSINTIDWYLSKD